MVVWYMVPNVKSRKIFAGILAVHPEDCRKPKKKGGVLSQVL